VGEVAREAGPLSIGLPEPVDRTMRLGPFPSVRQALKFATFSAVAVVAGSLFGPVWSVPWLGGGFVLAVYRNQGEGLDDRAAARVGFLLRSRARRRGRGDAVARGPYGTWLPGRLVAVLATGGVPVAFLPPTDARALFDRFRALLNHLDHGLILVAGVVPLRAEALAEDERNPLAGTPEAAARAGYLHLRTLVARKRYHRRVLVGLWVDAGLNGATERLDAAADRLAEDLRQMGLAAERLRDRALVQAAEVFGAGVPGSG
jgi:hypothetical protein